MKWSRATPFVCSSLYTTPSPPPISVPLYLYHCSTNISLWICKYRRMTHLRLSLRPLLCHISQSPTPRRNHCTATKFSFLLLFLCPVGRVTHLQFSVRKRVETDAGTINNTHNNWRNCCCFSLGKFSEV